MVQMNGQDNDSGAAAAIKLRVAEKKGGDDVCGMVRTDSKQHHPEEEARHWERLGQSSMAQRSVCTFWGKLTGRLASLLRS